MVRIIVDVKGGRVEEVRAVSRIQDVEVLVRDYDYPDPDALKDKNGDPYQWSRWEFFTGDEAQRQEEAAVQEELDLHDRQEAAHEKETKE